MPNPPNPDQYPALAWALHRETPTLRVECRAKVVAKYGYPHNVSNAILECHARQEQAAREEAIARETEARVEVEWRNRLRSEHKVHSRRVQTLEYQLKRANEPLVKAAMERPLPPIALAEAPAAIVNDLRLQLEQALAEAAELRGRMAG